MFSSLLRYGIEGTSRSPSSSTHINPTVPDSSTRAPYEGSAGNTGTTVVLPHPASWATETPPQTQPLPVLEFRIELVEEKACGCRRTTVARPPCEEDNAEEHYCD
ncbi:hypothetical protein BKA70DRAFT_1447103 [Coprinopsis sp. MPI-PUGE-AT-0042]|nr:hypothetical protein BKA70DRAFT_1447103 [Coprinopsis sp. MPI-PUGE-AT-0042]